MARLAMQMRRLFIWPDTHVPYQDHRAFKLALNAAATFKPTDIIIQGDFWDAYCVSDFPRDPTRMRTVKEEILAVNQSLDLIGDLEIPYTHYLDGNHEYRMVRYLQKRAPELWGLLDTAELLQIKRRKWKHYRYGEMLRIGKVYYTHDVDGHGKRATQQALDEVGGNIVIGHTHRISSVYQSTILGEEHVGMSFGWLGDVKQIDYAKRPRTRGWMLGFGTGLVMPNGNTFLRAHPIINYTCEIDGKVIRL